MSRELPNRRIDDASPSTRCIRSNANHRSANGAVNHIEQHQRGWTSGLAVEASALRQSTHESPFYSNFALDAYLGRPNHEHQ
jgi:hypothetical protein